MILQVWSKFYKGGLPSERSLSEASLPLAVTATDQEELALQDAASRASSLASLILPDSALSCEQLPSQDNLLFEAGSFQASQLLPNMALSQQSLGLSQQSLALQDTPSRNPLVEVTSQNDIFFNAGLYGLMDSSEDSQSSTDVSDFESSTPKEEVAASPTSSSPPAPAFSQDNSHSMSASQKTLLQMSAKPLLERASSFSQEQIPPYNKFAPHDPNWLHYCFPQICVPSISDFDIERPTAKAGKGELTSRISGLPQALDWIDEPTAEDLHHCAERSMKGHGRGRRRQYDVSHARQRRRVHVRRRGL